MEIGPALYAMMHRVQKTHFVIVKIPDLFSLPHRHTKRFRVQKLPKHLTLH